ncbi:hypothetical protein ANTPLA_LOCUS8320 [Anthophora plagiata]
MTDVNSNKVSSGESSRKSFELARKELRTIVTRIEEYGLVDRSMKLFRARCMLRRGGSKLRKRHLWILLILAWILGQFLWNYWNSVRHGKSLYDGEDANCQFFPYKTEFKSLQDVFDMNADRSSLEKGTKPWYVGWSNCDEEIGNVLRQHYRRPYFLPVNAESEKTDWIFMGSHGYGAPMHVDDVERPSWQAQIKGEKLWILEPPRECHYSCNRLEVVVYPGEIIVLDTNRWYHQTKIVSNEMSITIGAEYD